MALHSGEASARIIILCFGRWLLLGGFIFECRHSTNHHLLSLSLLSKLGRKQLPVWWWFIIARFILSETAQWEAKRVQRKIINWLSVRYVEKLGAGACLVPACLPRSIRSNALDTPQAVQGGYGIGVFGLWRLQMSNAGNEFILLSIGKVSLNNSMLGNIGTKSMVCKWMEIFPHLAALLFLHKPWRAILGGEPVHLWLLLNFSFSWFLFCLNENSEYKCRHGPQAGCSAHLSPKHVMFLQERELI